MKKMVMTMLVFTTLTMGQMPQVKAESVNPLVVARALALKNPHTYHGRLGCKMLIDNVFQPMEMEFSMTKDDHAIYKLAVSGENISLPEPIYGLPMGNGGLMRDVFLNISAMTRDGEYAGNGYVQKEVVSQNDTLTIILTPADLKQQIPGDFSAYGNDVDLVIEGLTYGYGWGVENGNLYVYLPPVGGQYHYIVRRWSDGSVIGEGWLEPFMPVETSDNAHVSVSYLGNVQEVEFTREDGLDDWAGIHHLSLDCEIPTDDGLSVMGKVIFTDAGTGGLEIMVSGDFWIYVQSATSDDGDMPFFPLEDYSTTNNEVRTVGKNVGKVVITIIPKPTNNRPEPWINLHRFYGSPSSGGKG
jgi:hypothetical protein